MFGVVYRKEHAMGGDNLSIADPPQDAIEYRLSFI